MWSYNPLWAGEALRQHSTSKGRPAPTNRRRDGLRLASRHGLAARPLVSLTDRQYFLPTPGLGTPDAAPASCVHSRQIEPGQETLPRSGVQAGRRAQNAPSPYPGSLIDTRAGQFWFYTDRAVSAPERRSIDLAGPRAHRLPASARARQSSRGRSLRRARCSRPSQARRLKG
jgi:hypothetical protein